MDRWTLGQLKAQKHYLYVSCPAITAMQMLDLDELIGRFGAGFDIVGTQLTSQLKCPCGSAEHAPHVGVGERAHVKGGEPGGAHSMSHSSVSIGEATRRQLESNRIARETNPLERQRHKQLQDDLAKIREKKRRRRERNPYDFS